MKIKAEKIAELEKERTSLCNQIEDLRQEIVQLTVKNESLQQVEPKIAELKLMITQLEEEIKSKNQENTRLSEFWQTTMKNWQELNSQPSSENGQSEMVEPEAAQVLATPHRRSMYDRVKEKRKQTESTRKRKQLLAADPKKKKKKKPTLSKITNGTRFYVPWGHGVDCIKYHVGQVVTKERKIAIKYNDAQDLVFVHDEDESFIYYKETTVVDDNDESQFFIHSFEKYVRPAIRNEKGLDDDYNSMCRPRFDRKQHYGKNKPGRVKILWKLVDGTHVWRHGVALKSMRNHTAVHYEDDGFTYLHSNVKVNTWTRVKST